MRSPLAFASAVLLAALVVAPAAFAGEQASTTTTTTTSSTTSTTVPADPDAAQWDESKFTVGEGKTGFTSDTEVVSIVGTLIYEKRIDVERIESATVTVIADPDADPPMPKSCRYPDPVTLTAPEIDTTSTRSVLPFDVTLPFPCNGPYLVTADATATNDHAHTMKTTLGVSAPPGPVEGLTVTEEAGGVVRAKWKAPAPEPPDIVGYLVERAGPNSTTNFKAISGVLAVKEYAEKVPANGTYVFRARAVRRAATGTVTSAPAKSPTKTIEVTSGPTTTTTTTQPTIGGGGGIPTIPAQNPPPSLPPPPTTVDPGFGEITYGDRPTLDTSELPELPAEEIADGASIVRDEDEGTSLVVPLAGSLVLVVWASHLLYLNRLARVVEPPVPAEPLL